MKLSDITIIENSEYELIQQQHTEDKMYRSTQFKSYYHKYAESDIAQKNQSNRNKTA